MIDLIFWWTGAVFCLLASVYLMLFFVGYIGQKVINKFWQRMKNIHSYIELQKAWKLYEQQKESQNDR